jgi:succinoglycan biosynthesis transport protein ExoP
MNPSNPMLAPPASPGDGDRGGYGGYRGYSGYPGYPGAASGEPMVQRAFRDYLLILRERKWYILVVFLVIFSSTVVFTLSRTKLYQSSASIQVLRRDPVVMQVQGVVDNEIRSAEDLNTQVQVLESTAIMEKVAEHLTGDDLAKFIAPYQGKDGAPVSLLKILERNRKVIPSRLSLVVSIQYTHPDPVIAAEVANYFMDEYIAYNSKMRVDESMKAVDDLDGRIEEQKQKVEQMGLVLQAYREKNNMVSLDQKEDIVTEKLKALNLYVTQTSSKLKDAEVRWNQIKDHQAKGEDLLDLDFVAGQANISNLVQQLAAQKILISQLSDRYRAMHPKMIAAMNQQAEIEHELKGAIDTAAATIGSDYQNALSNDGKAHESLAAAEQESLKLGRYAVDYANLDRDYQINEKLLESIVSRMSETRMTSAIETQSARVIDRATPASGPIYPNKLLNLSLGLVSGLGLGLAFAFFVSYIDDRVKSSFDIEAIVGLPLIGIIPEIENLNQSDKAQIVDNHADRQVAEAFLALHAGLQLKNESKNAQCFLVTSTIPGEGKSFCTTNLALTFATHGERTVIVDCDLRKPNVHKSFQVENLKGVIDYCQGNGSLDEVLVKNVKPNLDLVLTGGRAKSPTQILNSKPFETLISELRKRYDRVIVDTPPLAVVSDALIVLPLMDASIFTIYFGRIRRKAAQFCARQMQEANIPCCGAILNGLNLDVSGYYYAQYYDKSYKGYYGTESKDAK